MGYASIAPQCGVRAPSGLSAAFRPAFCATWRRPRICRRRPWRWLRIPRRLLRRSLFQRRRRRLHAFILRRFVFLGLALRRARAFLQWLWRRPARHRCAHRNLWPAKLLRLWLPRLWLRVRLRLLSLGICVRSLLVVGFRLVLRSGPARPDRLSPRDEPAEPGRAADAPASRSGRLFPVCASGTAPAAKRAGRGRAHGSDSGHGASVPRSAQTGSAELRDRRAEAVGFCPRAYAKNSTL